MYFSNGLNSWQSRDFVTPENHCQITSHMTKISLTPWSMCHCSFSGEITWNMMQPLPIPCIAIYCCWRLTGNCHSCETPSIILWHKCFQGPANKSSTFSCCFQVDNPMFIRVRITALSVTSMSEKAASFSILCIACMHCNLIEILFSLVHSGRLGPVPNRHALGRLKCPEEHV